MDDFDKIFNSEKKINYEKLFLFEFLVDNVRVYNSKLSVDKATLSVLGPVAIRFQFLNYPAIEVCEESFAPGTKPLMEEKSVPMKSGKSCMFSLSPLKSQKVLTRSAFDVLVTCYQYKLQKCCAPGQVPPKPEDVFIGRTKVSMADVFKDFFTESMENTKRLTRTKTGCNKLIDNNGADVGNVTFVVRISCFGFMLMTGFQLPDDQRKDFKYKHIEYDRPELASPADDFGPAGDDALVPREPKRRPRQRDCKKDRAKAKGECCKKHARKAKEPEHSENCPNRDGRPGGGNTEPPSLCCQPASDAMTSSNKVAPPPPSLTQGPMDQPKDELGEVNRENYEKLFLFEFLVDNVTIYNSRLAVDKATLSILGPMAVRFQFLNYPPIEVCEESFAPSTKPLMEEKSVPMKNGKSCMFSLSSMKSQRVMSQSSFEVFLTVYQYKLQRCCAPGQVPGKPEDVFIGRTKLNLTEEFKDLFNRSLKTTNRITHSKKACNKLVDNGGVQVGKIMFVVRVSCFGFMVMTGFQLPEEQQKDFKYKHIEYDEPSSKDPVPSATPDQPPNQFGDGPSKTDPCAVCNPCQESKKGKKDKKKEKKKHLPADQKDKKKEGHEGAAKQPPACPYGFPPCPCACTMNQGAPQGFAKPTSFSAGQLPHQNSGLNGLVQTPYAHSAASQSQPAGPNRARDIDIDPGAVGIRGNQLVFKMPDKQTTPQVPVEGKFASSVYYKMDDENQNGARNVIQILPKNPNVDSDKFRVNEKQDVLVLKLGKKRMAAGKRPKLELELRTPKMKEEKPPTDVKDTQYLLSDIPKPKPAKSGKGSAKGSKKGSKKGKGKKK